MVEAAATGGTAGGTADVGAAAAAAATPVADAKATVLAAAPVVAAPAKAEAAAAAVAAAVEAKYELKLPENAAIQATSLAEIEAFAKEHKISPDAAQKILERENASVSAERAARAGDFAKARGEWETQARADAEFGGAQFDVSLSKAQTALAKFATPELRTMLEKTGFGNHPEVVRLLYRVGLAMSEDKAVATNGGGNPTRKPTNLADALYGSKA